MQCSMFNKHTVTECECCGELMWERNEERINSVSGEPYAVAGDVSALYSQHLNASPDCKAWHDALPTFDDVRGILKGAPDLPDWSAPSESTLPTEEPMNEFPEKTDEALARMTLDPGELIHIRGLPFLVVTPITIESHPNNFPLAGLPTPSQDGEL